MPLLAATIAGCGGGSSSEPAKVLTLPEARDLVQNNYIIGGQTNVPVKFAMSPTRSFRK